MAEIETQQNFEDAVETDQPIFAEPLEDEALPMVEGEVVETLEEGDIVTDEAGHEIVEGHVEGFEQDVMYHQQEEIPQYEIPQYQVPGMQTYYTIPQAAPGAVPQAMPQSQYVQYANPYDAYQQQFSQPMYYTQPATLAQDTTHLMAQPATEGVTTEPAPMQYQHLPTISSMTIPINPYAQQYYGGAYGYSPYGYQQPYAGMQQLPAEAAPQKKKKHSCNCF